MEQERARITGLQNFSVNDGDGVRTVVFFAGCPLRCKWCANPEGYTSHQKIAYHKSKCMKCGKCVEACSSSIEMDLNAEHQRKLCTSCGRCTLVCPTHARKQTVFDISLEAFIESIEKQKIFYRFSGGGVTFSGGEATLQPNFLRKAVNFLYDQAVNMALETSGQFEFELVKDFLEKIDLIFYDIKHMDKDLHKAFTGVSNEQILENAVHIGKMNIPIIVRVPVIVGVNADEKNMRETARFVKSTFKNPKMELLPYHTLGYEKYEALGLITPVEGFMIPSADQMKHLMEIIQEEGVIYISYL